MTSYLSNARQNIFDVALMQFGSLEGLINLFQNNSELIQADGQVHQANINYLISAPPVNVRYQLRLLEIIPTTEGPDDGYWLTSDNGYFLNQDSGRFLISN